MYRTLVSKKFSLIQKYFGGAWRQQKAKMGLSIGWRQASLLVLPTQTTGRLWLVVVVEYNALDYSL